MGNVAFVMFSESIIEIISQAYIVVFSVTI